MSNGISPRQSRHVPDRNGNGKSHAELFRGMARGSACLGHRDWQSEEK